MSDRVREASAAGTPDGILPMEIGIGVDDGIHLVARYVRSPARDVKDVLRTTGAAVVLTVAEYSQEEKKGNKVRMEILSWDENCEIPPERFRMDVPPGTKTIRLDGKKGPTVREAKERREDDE